jgi:hypothetical protein
VAHVWIGIWDRDSCINIRQYQALEVIGLENLEFMQNHRVSSLNIQYNHLASM